MHSITFAIPHLFSSESSSAEKGEIRNSLSTCLAKLCEDDSRTRLLEAQEGDSDVTFLLPRVFSRGSKLLGNSRAAEALLECLTEIDFLYLAYRGGRIIPLYSHPLRYKRTVVWDTTPALYARNYGDCKSLACTRVAEYRFAKRESRPFFRFVPPELNPEKEFMYHIVVGHDGIQVTFEDPSKIKGMGQDEWAYFEQKPKLKGILAAAGEVVTNLFR